MVQYYVSIERHHSMTAASAQARLAREGKKKRVKKTEGEALAILTVSGRKKRVLAAGKFEEIYRAARLERVRVIKAGVAPAAVKDIAVAMGSPQEVVIKNLGISRSTWARKRSQQVPLEQHASEKVMGLAALIGQVESLVKEQRQPKGFD